MSMEILGMNHLYELTTILHTLLMLQHYNTPNGKQSRLGPDFITHVPYLTMAVSVVGGTVMIMNLEMVLLVLNTTMLGMYHFLKIELQ